jgi:hypothetical protein
LRRSSRMYLPYRSGKLGEDMGVRDPLYHR